MKSSFRSLFLGAAVLTVPQFASASFVLVGFHNFDGTAAAETVPLAGPNNNFAYPGFSGQIVKGQASVDLLGSNDGRYGSMDPTGDENWVKKENVLAYAGPSLTPSGGDGALVGDNQTPFVFSVTNNLSIDVTLEALLFDAATPFAPGQIARRVDVEWGWMGLSEVAYDYLGTFTSNGTQYGIGVPVDYPDDAYATNDILPAGDTIYFRFTPLDGEMRFDNIGLTGFLAIPEPGSLIALGCLVGSGAFLRSRRRSVTL